MLILTRRASESITIGDDVQVTVLGVKGSQVRVGIDAPKCSAQDYCRTFSQIIHHTIELKPGRFPTLWS